MKRPLLAILGIILAIIVVIGWKFIFPKKRDDNGLKPQGLTVSKHSSGFNESMSNAMNSYYALTESFVNWDTAKINTSLAELKTSIDSLRIEEMQKDTAIYEKRESLNMLSQQMFDLLRIVKYDAAKVYYQECPMALNNYESSAFWLSTEGESKKRRNPYLGLHDPKYGKAMLTCGATRDSINYVTSPAAN